jgi:tripartite-type tricarboxylate transporter receptor subunit TctC
MNILHRCFLQLAMITAALPVLSQSAFAQQYPTRPIHLLVGFAAGGAADIVCRILGDTLTKSLGQQVVVENRPGAGSAISIKQTVDAQPDGYTMVYYGVSAIVNELINPKVHDLQRGIAPVAGLVEFPMVLEAHQKFQARTVADLVAYAKANPGKLNMGSYGAGTMSQLAGELFKTMAGINMVHVPFNGGAPMATSMRGGHIDVAFDVFTNSQPHILSGDFLALGVLGAKRLPQLPDVPTVSETLTGYEAVVWTGIGVPKATPGAIIARLNREINAALNDPPTRSRMEAAGAIPMLMTTERYGAFVETEFGKWTEVVHKANIKAE